MAILGRYEIFEQVGRGAMGVVYRARDKVLDRFVALKILRTGPEIDRELRERFYREAMFGARLQHPNIAVVYDLGEIDNVPFIAMELLKGADLRKYIEEQRFLSLEQKLDIMAQVCDGIAYAHREGIVHRDIKPSNIFIHEQRQAKVLDFGIARLPTSTLTVVGNILGTPNYMAPEQILSKPCDQRSDLFSAAIVFYEFLVYSHPFKATFIPRRIADGTPDSLYDHESNIPPALDELIQKALAKLPSDRIQTAEELGAGLRRIATMLRSGFAVHDIPAAPAASGNGQAPGPLVMDEGQDNSRGRLVAESIRLDKEFETALDTGNLLEARGTLEEMRRLASVDSGVLPLLAEREKQLNEASDYRPARGKAMTAAAGAGSTFDAAAFPASTPTYFPFEGLTSRESATELVAGKSNPEEPGIPASVTAAEGAVTSDPGQPASILANLQAAAKFAAFTRGVRSVVERMRVSVPGIARIGLGWASSHKYVLTAVAALIIVAPLAALAIYRTPTPINLPVGEAVVRNSNVDVLDQPADTGKRIRSIGPGSRVSLLEPLKMREQVWIRVQHVSGDMRQIDQPGYVRVDQLSSCWSNDPRTAWNCTWLSNPGPHADNQKTEAFATQLEKIASRYPSFAARAEIACADLYVKLARNGGQAERDGFLKQADTALDKAVNLITEDSPEIKELRNEVGALKSPDSPLDQRPDPEIRRKIEEIRALKDAGKWEVSKALAIKFLNTHPGNIEAMNLLHEVVLLIATENGESDK